MWKEVFTDFNLRVSSFSAMAMGKEEVDIALFFRAGPPCLISPHAGAPRIALRSRRPSQQHNCEE